MIVIVDYGMGNLRSVEKAFEYAGAHLKVSSLGKDIEKAEKLVMPGVGAFTHAMRELKARRLVEPIREKILSGAPYLGLCLGLQLLFSRSAEGARVKGLDLIPGNVVRFKGTLKVPHMGWNTIEVKKSNCPILRNVKKNDYFYFVHSYYGVPEDKSWVLAQTSYGAHFCSALWKGNIFATQFHPEKSQSAGLRIIKNFVELK
ncbi:MAG: imidazole glycerol phosphate synthase subunit HisH [Candidatus Omnitrophica bacterium CG07_land_8_20_14_0_80_50_8]|nr:MAG: imidazole glycerol phosphate synthase subunit HisH [Candidatus Omnitrophica bacterium CG07_land_8_20_14_0_80_50_8]